MARLFRILLGFALIVAGLFMLVAPGPGILTIAAGLALLRRDLEWAGRLSAWAKRKVARRQAPLPAASATPPKASLGEETTAQDGG